MKLTLLPNIPPESGGGANPINEPDKPMIVPTSIELTPSEGSISELGSQRHITATILPKNTNQTITWSSDNPDVARIVETYDNRVRVMGYAPGTATITAETVNGLEATALIHCVWD